MRVRLKVACIESGKTQRQIAAESKIPENRFSEIVRGWVEPTADERAVLARVIGQSADRLFAQTPREELQVRALQDGLQQAILAAQELGHEPFVDAIGTLKVQVARHFAATSNASHSTPREA